MCTFSRRANSDFFVFCACILIDLKGCSYCFNCIQQSLAFIVSHRVRFWQVDNREQIPDRPPPLHFLRRVYRSGAIL